MKWTPKLGFRGQCYLNLYAHLQPFSYTFFNLKFSAWKKFLGEKSLYGIHDIAPIAPFLHKIWRILVLKITKQLHLIWQIVKFHWWNWPQVAIHKFELGKIIWFEVFFENIWVWAFIFYVQVWLNLHQWFILAFVTHLI